MTVDIEKRKEIAKTFLLGGFWFTDCEEPLDEQGNIINFENFRLLKEKFDEIPDQKFTLERLYRIAINLRNSGALIRKVAQVVQAAPPPVDPKTTIPHRDLFPKIDSIEKAIHFVKTAKIPGDRLNALNELLAYLQLHDIHTWDIVSADLSKPEPVKSDPNDGSYGEARAVVAAVTARDVSSTSSAPGQDAWSKANRFKTKIGRIIDQQEQKDKSGQAGQAVLKWVKKELADLQSSSVS